MTVNYRNETACLDHGLKAVNSLAVEDIPVAIGDCAPPRLSGVELRARLRERMEEAGAGFTCSLCPDRYASRLPPELRGLTPDPP